MCGIVGIASHEAVARDLYDSLIHLQHRGQDAAGILTCHERFDLKTGMGLARDIFKPEDLTHLHGHMGIAHNRYPTSGHYTMADVQPLWVGNPRGVALAHNGHLVNYDVLADRLVKEKHHNLSSNSDSEVLLHLLAEGLQAHANIEGIGAPYFDGLGQAVTSIFDQAEGSYSVTAMVIGKGMLAFRDPHGIRPLVMGVRHTSNQKKDYIFASETTMFYSLGFEPMGDVKPGELVFVNHTGELFRKTLTHQTFTPCIFEYIYFARPDATLDDVNVYRARLRLGENLAKLWQKRHPEVKPDVVIPVPFTSNTSAIAAAQELGVPYSEGLYKNPFVGRTFIMPDNEKRRKNIRYKLTPQRIELEGKNVLIIDDSIVRGNTSREIVKMVREHGAKQVYFASSAPPIRFPCFYGIDMPSKEDLVASRMHENKIKAYLGVDILLYQSIEHMIEAVTRKGKHYFQTPCKACMDGAYITGTPNMNKQQQDEVSTI